MQIQLEIVNGEEVLGSVDKPGINAGSFGKKSQVALRSLDFQHLSEAEQKSAMREKRCSTQKQSLMACTSLGCEFHLSKSCFDDPSSHMPFS